MISIRPLSMLLAISVAATPLISIAQEPATKATTTPTKNLLDIVPDDIWAMLYMPSLAQLDQKTAMYAQRLNLPMMGGPSQMARMMAGLVTGVDDRREFAVLLFPFNNWSTTGGSVAILIPTTDHAALIQMLGPEDAGEGMSKIRFMDEESYTAHTGGYAIIAPQPELVTRILKADKFIRSKLNRHQLDRLATDDLTVWANLEAFTSSDLFRGFIQMLEASGAGMGVGKISEFSTAQVSLRHEQTGINVGLYVDAKPATEVHAAMAEMPSTTESLLGGLPGGPFVVAGGQIRTKSVSDMSAKMFDEMLAEFDKKLRQEGEGTESDTASDEKKIAKVLSQVRGPVKTVIAELASAAIGVSPLPEGADGMFAAAKVITTHGAAAQVPAALKEIIDGIKAAFAEEPDVAELLNHIEYKSGAEQAGSASVDHLVVTLPEQAKADMGEEGMTAFKAVFGNDGLLARIAVVDDRHVVITLGGGTAHIGKVADLVKSGSAPLSGDAGLKRIASFVPRKRNTEVYFAVDQLAMLVGRVVRAVGKPFPYTIPEVNAPVAIVTSFVAPAGSQTDVYIPIELIVAIKDLVTNAMGQQMDAGAPAS